MKSASIIQLLGLTSLSILGTNAIDETTNPFVAASSTDKRSPCPGLNALANHGILPHDGLDIDLATVITAMKTGYNMEKDAAVLVGTVALKTSTTGNASTFNLDDLDVHGVIEHDGSLSRADIYSGDNHSFNKTIWAETTAGFTDETISIPMAAAARKARLAKDAEENPDFNMTTSALSFSFIESALYLTAFGDLVEGNANRTWVEYWFEQERLPFSLGWSVPEQSSNVSTIETLAARVQAGE